MQKVADVLPRGKHNEKLISNVHPPDWRNPEPTGRYNLVVIGAGSAGLVSAAGAVALGAKVALVERHLLGGDCLNVGCVPSKCLIRSSRVIAELQSSEKFGIKIPGLKLSEVDFPAVMERMRALRARISDHDSAGRFQKLGVDVFLGEGRFISGKAVRVGDSILNFKRAVIATGARPACPDIEGLEQVGYLTNETVFNLTERPERLAVIGAGPIGCELAQAMSLLGSRVMLLHNNSRIMNREDQDVSEILQKIFLNQGIDLVLDCKITGILNENGGKTLHFSAGERQDKVTVDQILVSAGRVPDLENLGLETAGVQYDPRKGVLVDDRLRTTNRRIYAAGDICMKHKFTHAADSAARIVLRNALFFGRSSLSALTIPHCTYTDPEIAHVGLSASEAQSRGIEIDTFARNLKDVDRAITDGEEEGLVKIHLKKGTDKILGATIIARHAGEMISEITLAMVAKVGLGKISGVIHPYPTQAEAIKQVADAYYRSKLTPTMSRFIARWLAWIR